MSCPCPCPGGGREIDYLDALFTAASAVCVTGLITVDTAGAWSPLGQGVILGMIQLGGLGILTFSTFFLLLLGRPMALSQRGLLARTHGKLMRIQITGLLVRIVAYALAIEAIGAVVLSSFFTREAGLASDVDQEAVNDVGMFITQAVVGDVTDRRVLEELDIASFDYAVISLGDEHMDPSILATLHARSLGVPNIYVKAVSHEHARILELIGATKVIHLEREVAESLAEALGKPSWTSSLSGRTTRS